MNTTAQNSRQIFVFTAGDPAARAHLDDSIRKPIDLGLAIASTPPSAHEMLNKIAADNGGLYAWGAVPGKMNRPLYRMMNNGDWVLCVYDKTFHFVAQVVGKLESKSFAEKVWGTLPDGKTWELMYFLTKPVPVHKLIGQTGGYFPSQFMGFSKPKVIIPQIVRDYQSVDRYIKEIFGVDATADISSTNSTPPVTEENFESENQYFIIRSNESSSWADELGRTYRFGISVPNQLKLRKGGYVVVDRKAPEKPNLIGWGQLEPAEEIPGNQGNGELVARFSLWDECSPPVSISDNSLYKIRSLPAYNAQHAVRPITKEIFEALVNEMKQSPVTQSVAMQTQTPYGIEDARDDLFIEQAELESIVALFKRKRNLILQGPPGVGKTYFAQRLAHLITGNTDPNAVAMVQFHQSYSYEDFIQGYRPNEDGSFHLKPGTFYSLCTYARQHPAQVCVFVIDEINRGNLSKIFGELMMLIEADKRGPSWAIPLTYSKDASEKFYVPENVYLLGMMNTADRSLAMVDYALRRRFVFWEMTPAVKSKKFADFFLSRGGSQNLLERIIQRIGDLNAQIEADRNLGTGFLIGHSYFTPQQNVLPDDQWYQDIISYEIAPLIREYWFDRTKQDQDSIIEKLRS